MQEKRRPEPGSEAESSSGIELSESPSHAMAGNFPCKRVLESSDRSVGLRATVSLVRAGGSKQNSQVKGSKV